MKIITLIYLAFIFIAGGAVAQTADKIREEAYPEYKDVTDNSEFGILWRQLIDAKHNNDASRHNLILNEIKRKFPDKLSRPVNNLPLLKAEGVPPQPPFSGNDWTFTDARVYFGNIYTGNTNSSAGETPRTIRFRSDSLGNKYAACIRSTRDTMYIMRSTNQGNNWTLLQKFSLASPSLFHSFDFYITDSASTFKLGFAVSIVSGIGMYDGTLLFVSLNSDGTGFRVNSIQTTPSGRGLINPAIVSDGFNRTPGTTYWYVTYSNYSPSTPTANDALAAISMDWGVTWVTSVARSTFNDYDLDIDVGHYAASDTVFVVLTNNLTLTNSNLRLRKIALANYPSGTWGQFNVASSALPEFSSTMSVNRITNEMIVTYTISNGGDDNIGYNYSNPSGSYFTTTGYTLTALPNAENLPTCFIGERDGNAHISYLSHGTTYDSVIYTSSPNLALGFIGHQKVNDSNSAAGVAPDVFSFRTAAALFFGGVVYSGVAGSNVYYDAGDRVATGIVNNSSSIPSEYSLSQNYPNPFNPSTKIGFSVPASGFTSLKVFDASGKLVAELVNGNLNAGSYEVTFNASAFPSGVYFYKLSSQSFTETKKMLLVK